MKHIFCILLLATTRNYAQCPFPVTLQSSQGHCLGAVLQVDGNSGTFSKITWYNGSTVDSISVASQTARGNGITAAGGNGSGNAANQLSYPLGIFVDASGNLYVADNQNNRVVRYAPGAASGVVVAGDGSGGPAGQVISPYSVFVDARGNVYVLCAETNFNIGTVVEEWAPGAATGVIVAGGNGTGAAANQFNGPTGIYVDGQGNIYVCDELNFRVQKWAPGAAAGVTVAGGNGQGSAANQLYTPQGIFVDGSGNLYVTDQDISRVQKWPPGATSGITVAGGNGVVANFQPIGVFVDGSGNVYISDPFNNIITEWLPGATSGVTVLGGNGMGSGADQFNGSAFFWLDAIGDMYVSDANNNRVQEYKLSSTIDTTYTAQTPGEYTAVVTDQYGCTVTTNGWLINPPTNPLVTINSSANPVCSGTPVAFTAVVSGDNNAIPIYQWKVNGMNTGIDSMTYVNDSLNNGDIISCVVSSEDACASAASNSITENILATPSIDPGQVFSTQEGRPVTLEPVLTGDITTYTWSPSAGLSDTTVRDPVADPLNSTRYDLQVVASDGCKASGTIVVEIFIPLSIPNAFTPNGDGRNDIFYIAGGPPGSLLADFSVYNRWGQKVFQEHDCPTGDPAFGWNGRINGQEAPAGTYVYSVTLVIAGGIRKAYRGVVILIR